VGLLNDIVAHLEAHEIPFALCGASAMAFYGHLRFTADIDLLTTHPDVCETWFWRPLVKASTQLDTRIGDDSDPLRALTRIRRDHDVVDVIVGRFGWQSRAIGRAQPMSGLDEDSGLVVPVLDLSDLILSKLFAGSRADVQDIQALLEAQPELERPHVVDAVQRLLVGEGLSDAMKDLWLTVG